MFDFTVLACVGLLVCCLLFSFRPIVVVVGLFGGLLILGGVVC